MSTVTFNGTRLTSGNTGTGYSKVNSGGGGVSAEPQLAYRKPNVANVKSSSGGAQYGGLEYDHGSTTNMTGATNKLLILKGSISDNGDLSLVYGVRASIGSSNNANYEYNLAGSGANNDAYTDGYSSQGGLATNYLITCINPNIAQWREGTNGFPALTAVDYLNFLGNWVVGGAKTENLAFGPIDLGIGLNYSGANFTFEDGVAFDQDIDTNRYGLACKNGSVLTLRGLHRILANTSGEDISVVLFADGYHGTGDFGIEYNTTGSTASLNGSYSGLGRIYGADDTRPDLLFLNAGSASTHKGTFKDYRLIQMQSVITFEGATLRCQTITQNSGTIVNSTIETLSTAGNATITDADPSKISNVNMIQGGTGFGWEIPDGSGNVVLNNITWDANYGADGSNNACINYPGAAAITLSYSGGTKPTVTGNITVLENQINITFPNVPLGVEFSIKRGSNRIFHIQNTISNTVVFTTSLTNIPVKYIFNGAGIIKTLENTLQLTTENQTVPVTFETPDSYI